jgi:hypothetical protein
MAVHRITISFVQLLRGKILSACMKILSWVDLMRSDCLIFELELKLVVVEPIQA